MRNLEKNMPQSQSVADAFKEKNAQMIIDTLTRDKCIADVVSEKKLLCTECGAILIPVGRGYDSHYACPNSTTGKITCKESDHMGCWLLVFIVVVVLFGYFK